MASYFDHRYIDFYDSRNPQILEGNTDMHGYMCTLQDMVHHIRAHHHLNSLRLRKQMLLGKKGTSNKTVAQYIDFVCYFSYCANAINSSKGTGLLDFQSFSQ